MPTGCQHHSETTVQEVASVAPASGPCLAEWCPTCVYVPATRLHRGPVGERHRPRGGAGGAGARLSTVATDQTPEVAAVRPA
eukprot:2169363-Rhodomonas_salina.1